MLIDPVTPAGAALAWVDAWSKGWAKHDVETIVDRYAGDCVFQSHPFRPIALGRDAASTWIREAFGDERSARFAFGDPIVSPEGRAAVEYRAVITDRGGAESTLAGTTILRFDGDGRVVEHRDYWVTADGDLGINMPVDVPKEAT